VEQKWSRRTAEKNHRQQTTSSGSPTDCFMFLTQKKARKIGKEEEKATKKVKTRVVTCYIVIIYGTQLQVQNK